jgi:hypothetical protein
MSIYGCSHVCITLTIHHVNKFEMLGEMLRETEREVLWCRGQNSTHQIVVMNYLVFSLEKISVQAINSSPV